MLDIVIAVLRLFWRVALSGELVVPINWLLNAIGVVIDTGSVPLPERETD